MYIKNTKPIIGNLHIVSVEKLKVIHNFLRCSKKQNNPKTVQEKINVTVVEEVFSLLNRRVGGRETYVVLVILT